MSRIVKVKNNVIKTLTNVERGSNVATATTSTAHGFVVGNLVTVTADDSSYDVTNLAIASVPSSTTFSYANTGIDEAIKADTGTAGIQKVFNGQSIDPGVYYNITLELTSWNTNPSIQTSISTGDLVVSKGDEDGSDDIADVIEAWDWVRGSILEVTNFPISSQGNLKIVAYKPSDISTSIVTHNMCDPCSWYTESVAVVDEVLTDSGDGLTFNSLHLNWIDLYTGRVVKEHLLVDSYPIEIKVDSVVMQMGHIAYATASHEGVTYTAQKKGLDGNDIVLTFTGSNTIQSEVNAWNLANPYNPVLHDGTGTDIPSAASVSLVAGDYVFNCEDGTITFYSSQSGNTVEASYNYATGMGWRMVPQSGQELEIVSSELQFTTDIKLHSVFRFELWVYHPDQVNNPGVKIKIDEEVYNNMEDFISTCNWGQGTIPALDTLSQPVSVFPFEYASARIFKNSIGAELRLSNDDNIAIEGEFATATFYVLVRAEV